jgi:hypothetical protein
MSNEIDDKEPNSDSEHESVLQTIAPSSLEAIQRAEVDVAISTAKKFPRDVAAAIKTVKELALRNPKVAARCNYAVPKGGKTRVGPSVHFAKMVMYAWGNCTAISRVIGADRENVHIQGVFHDLEKNARIGIEMDWQVQAPKDRSDQMWKYQIDNAKRAGASVALRNAIIAGTPWVLFEDVAEEAKLVAVGEGKSFIDSRNNAVSVCKEMGITQAMIYKALNVGGLESITTDDLIWLHAVLQNIRDQTSTIEEVFGPPLEKAKVPPPKAPPQEERKPTPAAKTEPVRPAHEPQPKKRQNVPAPAAAPKKADVHEDPLFSEEEPRKNEPTPAAAKAQTASALAAKVRTYMTDANLSESEYIGWLSSIGCAGPSASNIEAIEPKYLQDTIANWDSNLEAILEWKSAEVK